MIWLATNLRAVALAGAAMALLSGFFYVSSIRADLLSTREAARVAEAAAETYRIAAERAVEDAEALILARDAAAKDYRSALDRIARAQGECLETRIPADLID